MVPLGLLRFVMVTSAVAVAELALLPIGIRVVHRW